MSFIKIIFVSLNLLFKCVKFVLKQIKTLFKKNINFFNENMDRYAICCCAKYEDNYIIEWITYHLNLGFDWIYINDNNDDSKILPSILEQKLPHRVIR